MTKEERELRAQVAQIKNEARQLVAEDKLQEAKDKAREAQELTDKADLLAQLESQEAVAPPAAAVALEREEQDKRYLGAFFKAFRRGALNEEENRILAAGTDGLHESPDENGGLLVPQDIQTKINEYKRSLSQLEPLITVVPTNTTKGRRVFEKISAMTPLENVTDDAADIAEMTPNKFESIEYSVKDYAGWMPIPNDLLEDSDQNIMEYLARWISKKSVVTRNGLILAILKAKTAVAFADYKAIKRALNVTLDPMFSISASIVTNQDGFQYLDTLEDKTGRPLLQVDVTTPTQKLFAGHPVKVIGNNVLPSEKTGAANAEKYNAPLLIGNLADAVTMFERKGYKIDSTNVGGTAFRKNRTELRVIEREDVVGVDGDAYVFGKIDVTGVL